MINEKESIQNHIKNFNEFKKKFLMQKRTKKEELKQLFLSGKKENVLEKNKNEIKEDLNEIKSKENNEKIIDIELSNGEIIKAKLSILKKYSNSVLAASLNSEKGLPKRNGHIFLDRESQSFKLLMYYLEKNKLPKFKNNLEEKKFFSEIKFWEIPIHISSKNILRFNPDLCPYFFTLDKRNQLLKKSNSNHGIVLLNKKLTALTPYIEFILSLNNVNQNKKILLALVDESKIEKNDLNKSFENNVPFVFYWDLFNEKIVKNNKNYYGNAKFRSMDLNKYCQCYKNNYETKYGLFYNQQEHSVELYRDDVKLDILIQNIEPGLTPALEIHIENCRIQLSSKNKYHKKIYL